MVEEERRRDLTTIKGEQVDGGAERRQKKLGESEKKYEFGRERLVLLSRSN